MPGESSLIAVPVEFDAAILARAVEDAVPRKLWSIRQRFERCVPKKQVSILGRELQVVPKIGCTVVGQVTRGAIRMHGEGRDLVFDLPLQATVSARDVGGVLKGETATGSALAQARIRLDLASDWTPRGTVRLRYKWSQPPGIDFLGQRITFTEQADRELKPIVRQLERSLPRELDKLRLRPMVEEVWRQGFTSIELNAENPPVWMRLTPRRPIFNGYSVSNGIIKLDLGIEAVTETFVGPRPANPEPTDLPTPGKAREQDRLNFFIPVVADYAELKPVIQRALTRRATRPFEVPGIGAIGAAFANVDAYGTGNGRIAVGFDVTARPVSMAIAETSGRIWLEARPINKEGSVQVAFADVSVSGDIARAGGDLLLQLANSPAVAEAIAEAVGQNFTKDYDELLVKIRKAIAEKHLGDFVIAATISDVETGRIEAFGKGLYLPVRAVGDAAIRYRPAR